MRCNMSLKIRLLHSHIDFFPENHVSVSEQFHLDISSMKERYHGKSVFSMFGDYLWSLISDDDSSHNRESSRISLLNGDSVKRRKIC